ncbi:hypothetical protein LCGC14_1828290, partial [marine sediment metagenome]
MGLRQLGNSLVENSKNKGLPLRSVRSILKKELGDDYDKYKYRLVAAIQKSKKVKVVEFWKQGNSLRRISGLTRFALYIVKAILAEELGSFYENRSSRLTYEEIKQLVPEEKFKQIVKLKENGKDICEIFDISKFPIKIIKIYLKEVGNRHLRFNSTEFSAKNVKQLYDSLTSKMIRLKQKSLGMKPKSSMVNIKQRVNDLREVCVRQCIDVREVARGNSIYWSLNVLGPIFIFKFLQANGLHFNFHSFIQTLQIDKREYFKGLKKINDFFLREYGYRDRKLQVMSIIEEVKAFFGLSLEFYQNAQKIIDRLWALLQNTTDEVLAGVISVLSVISINDESATVKVICDIIGTSYSSIIYQIRNKLLKRLNITGFKTFRQAKKV